MNVPTPTNRPVGESDPVQLNLTRGLILLLRGAIKRCPNCGGGPLFTRWVKMRHRCPRCHLILDRGEPDYFLGGFTVNFVAAELCTVCGAGAWIFLSWPDVPWTLITWSLILLMLVVPVAFYPFSKTLWLALDLLIRPVTLGDLAGHGENQEGAPADRGAAGGQAGGPGSGT